MSTEIKSVAIIGAGASGIITAYELLEAGIEKVTLFERQSSVGGLWNGNSYSLIANLDNIWAGEPPAHLDPNGRPEWTLGKISGGSNGEKEIQKEIERERWYAGGVYPSLFTNVPDKLMAYSFAKEYPQKESKHGLIKPFRTNKEVTEYLNYVIDVLKPEIKNTLKLNTRVEWVDRNFNFNKKPSYDVYWSQTESNHVTGGDGFNYNNVIQKGKSNFDAIVVATGHFHLPKVPNFKGLSESEKITREILNKNKNKNFKNLKLTRFEHPINYRANINSYCNKKILIVGKSISAIDIVRDTAKVAKTPIHISIRSNEWYYEWMKEAASVPNITYHQSEIDYFIPADLKTNNNTLDYRTTVVFKNKNIEKYDVIVLATGYYFHYPFLGDLVKVTNDGARVENLYLQTFTINEPTLSFVGVPMMPMLFRSFQAEAAALASVYTNKTKLPSVTEQLKWVKDREDKGFKGLKFHKYPIDSVFEFFDKLYNITDKNRPKALDYDDDLTEYTTNAKTSRALDVFYLRSGIPRYLNGRLTSSL